MNEVDETILTVFESRIRSGLIFYLVEQTDRVFWEQNNKFRCRNTREVNQMLKEVFDSMHTIYPSLKDVFDENLVLLQQCTWVGMNVPWPVDPDDHIQRVVDNVMEVFNIIVYANIRCEILNLDYESRSKL
jgi:glycosidase